MIFANIRNIIEQLIFRIVIDQLRKGVQERVEENHRQAKDFIRTLSTLINKKFD